MWRWNIFSRKGGVRLKEDCLEREESLPWHKIFIKKTKILKYFPIFVNFQNRFSET